MTGMPESSQMGFNIYNPGNEVCLTLLDTEMEKENEVGVKYPFDPLEYGECLISKKQSDSLGLKIGDIAYLEISV